MVRFHGAQQSEVDRSTGAGEDSRYLKPAESYYVKTCERLGTRLGAAHQPAV